MLSKSQEYIHYNCIIDDVILNRHIGTHLYFNNQATW